MLYKKYHTEDLRKHTFLVTGAAGFIGSSIIEYLMQHGARQVIGLDNLSTGFTDNVKAFEGNPAFQFVHGDINDENLCNDLCAQSNFVIHQAALGSVPRSIKDPVSTNKSNVEGFLKLLAAAKDQKVNRFIYASSSSVYGDNPSLPKKEEHTGKPLSPYAVTKQVNELYAGVFSSVYNLETIGLRYFNVFGPRQSLLGAYAAVIPQFINAILNERAPVIEGDGNQTRDFTFIENVVQANIKAVFAPTAAANKVYNIAVGDRTSINQLFLMLKAFAESTVEPVYNPERKGDVKNSLADISLAKEYLHYEPTVRISEGLKETYNWFKANHTVKTQK